MKITITAVDRGVGVLSGQPPRIEVTIDAEVAEGRDHAKLVDDVARAAGAVALAAGLMPYDGDVVDAQVIDESSGLSAVVVAKALFAARQVVAEISLDFAARSPERAARADEVVELLEAALAGNVEHVELETERVSQAYTCMQDALAEARLDGNPGPAIERAIGLLRKVID